MGDQAKPQAINRVQHSALLGAATIIAFYNQTIEGTVRAIAENFGVERDVVGGYGVLGDELISAGISESPEQVVRNIMQRLNLEIVDDLQPRDPTKPTRWSAGA